MEDGAREITREDLYKLVWSKSLVLAAEGLGISDVGLAKICRRLNVPRPYRGYWARLESGHRPTIPPLPQPKKGTPASAWVTRRAKPQSTEEELARSALTERERLPENRIVVPDNLRGAHPLVSETRRRLGHNSLGFDNRVYPSWNFNERQTEILNIKVSKNALYRALRITDALIRAIETRGGEVEIRDRKTFCPVNNAEVEFSLWEKVTRSERRLTEKELRESYVPDRWIFTPTGELVFRIDEIDIGRKNWKDKKDKPLEEQLNDVIIGLMTASRIIRERDLQRERERQRVLEEQERRAELARLQQIENKRRAQLDTLVDSWIRTANLRSFLSKCEETLSKPTGSLSRSEAAWLLWAQNYADKLDPFKSNILTPLVAAHSGPDCD